MSYFIKCLNRLHFFRLIHSNVYSLSHYMLSESNRQPIIALLSLTIAIAASEKKNISKATLNRGEIYRLRYTCGVWPVILINYLFSFDKHYKLIATPFIQFFTRALTVATRVEYLVLYSKRRRNEQKAYYYGNLGQQCVHIESLPWLTCFHFQCYVFLMAFSDNDGGGFDNDDL